MLRYRNTGRLLLRTMHLLVNCKFGNRSRVTVFIKCKNSAQPLLGLTDYYSVLILLQDTGSTGCKRLS
ncbi:hypothetical protein A8C56_03345 [Niabella ginsenosidivorans]|uniref:Uncharacterized protein n=1 Tax=Niabella ginsenosidivorans TaxID=1176587 RepID=A0A1A9HXK1_9BACT|nr:hypothetical protein A8C56_03345 [Niabella ginsenosidivorans]